jgi:hypothetical protein
LSDIFLSYARDDRDTAAQLAAALEAEQWDVWWDYELVAGDRFREQIQSKLAAARVVMVLWSPRSTRSTFVRDEAARAQARGALVPIVTGGLSFGDLPLGFGETHTEDLTGWSGDRADPRYQKLVAGLRRKLTAAARPDGGIVTPAGAPPEVKAEPPLPKPTRSKPPASPQAWTRGRSLLLVCLVLDITLVGAWLIFYAAHYATVSKIVAGIWAAVLAALGLFKVQAKETTLSDFLGLPPVKATGVTYTALILGALPFFVLWELPVHRVQIAAPPSADSIPLRLSVLRAADTVHLHVGALRPPGWRFFTRRGSYLLDVRPQRHEPQNRTLEVNWFSLSARVELDAFQRLAVTIDPPPESTIVNRGPHTTNRPPARTGTLVVRSTPPGLRVLVDGKDRGTTPVTVSVEAGQHTLELRRRIENTSFGYHLARNVEVRAAERTQVADTLAPVQLATLLVLLSDAGPTGASFYLDSSDESGLLGRVSGASGVFTVFPGERVVFKKVGNVITQCSRVTLAAQRQAEITC